RASRGARRPSLSRCEDRQWRHGCDNPRSVEIFGARRRVGTDAVGNRNYRQDARACEGIVGAAPARDVLTTQSMKFPHMITCAALCAFMIGAHAAEPSAVEGITYAGSRVAPIKFDGDLRNLPTTPPGRLQAKPYRPLLQPPGPAKVPPPRGRRPRPRSPLVRSLRCPRPRKNSPA